MLDVYNSDGTPLTADQLYVQLERICNASLQRDEEPVGILTTQHRDSWGRAYTRLINGELKWKARSSIYGKNNNESKHSNHSDNH